MITVNHLSYTSSATAVVSHAALLGFQSLLIK